jgi:hypothetical protein
MIPSGGHNTRRRSVLLSKHCPHTGVVNFYDASEPHIAIGSITKSRSKSKCVGYTWRFYAVDDAPFGFALDVPSAEKKLLAMAAKRTGVVKRVLELH